MSSDHGHAGAHHASPAQPGAAHEDDGAVHVHIASSPFYLGIFGALILLTFVTVKVSYYDFGPANIVIAIIIATMKASLVAAFFMHLRHDQLFNTIAFLGAFLFLGIFILLTYDDLGTRGASAAAYTGTVDRRTGELAPGGEPATTATAVELGGEAPKEGALKEGAGAGTDKKE